MLFSRFVASKRKRWVIFAIVFSGLAVAAVLALAAQIPFSSETLRARVESELGARLDSEVELGQLSLRLFPTVHVKGSALAVHHKGRRDVPPLISVSNFTVDADLIGLWHKRIKHVTLDGLSIQIPPDRHFGKDDDKDKDTDTDKDTAKDQPTVISTSGSEIAQEKPSRFVIESLTADNAKLTIIPRRKDKREKVWAMHKLHVSNLGVDQTMPFRSVLTNAVPPGQIETTGTFGPWNADDPGQTPLQGGFTFDEADLGYFKGIDGSLSAHGVYDGSLEKIDVRGETLTPDFMITMAQQPVPLTTKYHAIVDGTNGNTTLERIDATFLKTSIVAIGGVYDIEGLPGRIVTLDITMDDGHLEDIMRLAVKSKRPPMTGALHLKTKFELPPGDKDVVEKLRLNGQFVIEDGRFTDATVQQKIAELSRRGSGVKQSNGQANGQDGEPQPAPLKPVASDFTGRFKLDKGILALPTVTFEVPGAAVQLAGEYGLPTSEIAFAGNLYMDAKISETTTGWKSLLLKMVDPIFRKDGKTVIPIKIAGTRDQPSFGLDVKRVFKKGEPVQAGKVSN